MKMRRWVTTRGLGLALGLVVTLICCALWAGGMLARLDAYGLDWHFRYMGNIKPDPRIVMIDIDDHALTEIGSWPWPRRRHAQLVGILHQLGAKAIVLDLVFSEPTPPRVEHANLGRDYDLDPQMRTRGDQGGDSAIFDDDELARAMAKAGNVYTAMFFDMFPPGADPHGAVSLALDLWLREPSVTVAHFIEQVRPPTTWNAAEFYHQTRLAALLLDDFSLDRQALIEIIRRTGDVDESAIKQAFPGAKRLAAQVLAARFSAGADSKTFSTFFEYVLPGKPFDALSADRADLAQAFRSQMARDAMTGRNPSLPVELRQRVAQTGTAVRPLAKFIEASKGVGFVSIERTRSGGILREVPLVAACDGAMVSQLAFLVAIDWLGLDRTSIRYALGRLTIEGTERVGAPGAPEAIGKDERKVQPSSIGYAGSWPIDRRGNTLINWHSPPSGRWQDSFKHIPVARLLEIAANRRAIADNEKRIGLAWAELVELRHADAPGQYQHYVGLVNQRILLQAASVDGSPEESPGNQADRLASLNREIKQFEQEGLVWLRRAWRLWEQESPRNDAERAEREHIHRLFVDLAEGALLTRLTALNENLETRSSARIADLSPRIRGHICMVGYTASAVADLIATPVHPAMPGVMAHANILNMMLQNRPAFLAPVWANLGLLFLGGLVIGGITCTRGPMIALASLFVLVVIVLIGGAWLFRTSTIHVASLPAVGCLFFTWATVTLYRQLTEQRVRRNFQRALTQYTSPAIAATIADELDAASMAPRSAQVTCFFADLAGFTSLSERLGPQRTKDVLDPYLGAVSQALIQHDALVNKFMGDGVFAFFNAPIWTCPDHAQAACAAALTAQQSIRDLNRRASGDGQANKLVMRIGLSSGDTFVGDYGGRTKLDYTCIGDTVNIASRLEQANKSLGTGILVNEDTRNQAGDRFAFRMLGRFRVSGRTGPVDIFELVGLASDVSAELADFIASFERAVGCFQACQWNSCRKWLEPCRRTHPGDPLAQRYWNEVEVRQSGDTDTASEDPPVLPIL